MTEHVFEGVLEKTAGILKSKSKVWMVLHEKSLNYYNENRRSSCIGSIDLSEVQTVKPLPEKGGTQFEISTGTRSYIFAADSSEKCKEWVNQIHKAWAVERTQGDDSGNPNNSSEQNKHQDFSSQMGNTAVKTKTWEERMNSKTTDLPISPPSIENIEHVQRRPSKKDKSDSTQKESDNPKVNKIEHLSGPYDKPWSSYLSVFSGTEDPSSSSNGASVDTEASNTQERNNPDDEVSYVSVGWSNDAGKVEEDDLAGKYSQKKITEPHVSNSCSDQTQINDVANTDLVQLRRSSKTVKVHRDGSVSNVEDADRNSQQPAMMSKSRDVSKLLRQEAVESQPEDSEDFKGTAESSKDYTSQFAIVNDNVGAIQVKALDERPSVDSRSDLVQKASEGKRTTLPVSEANDSASFTVDSGIASARLIELLIEPAVPPKMIEIQTFRPALKQLKTFLENNCDLAHLNLNMERCTTAESAMGALKEFLDGI